MPNEIIEEEIDESRKPWDPKEIADKSFNEVLAKAISDDKLGMVGSTLASFKKGEAGAIKMVQQALMEHKYNEENSFPISDERYRQIIEMAAVAIGTGEI